MSYEEARARYSQEHRLDESHWISEKIVILFLESDLLSKERFHLTLLGTSCPLYGLPGVIKS